MNDDHASVAGGPGLVAPGWGAGTPRARFGEQGRHVVGKGRPDQVVAERRAVGVHELAVVFLRVSPLAKAGPFLGKEVGRYAGTVFGGDPHAFPAHAFRPLR